MNLHLIAADSTFSCSFQRHRVSQLPPLGFPIDPFDPQTCQVSQTRKMQLAPLMRNRSRQEQMWEATFLDPEKWLADVGRFSPSVFHYYIFQIISIYFHHSFDHLNVTLLEFPPARTAGTISWPHTSPEIWRSWIFACRWTTQLRHKMVEDASRMLDFGWFPRQVLASMVNAPSSPLRRRPSNSTCSRSKLVVFNFVLKFDKYFCKLSSSKAQRWALGPAIWLQFQGAECQEHGEISLDEWLRMFHAASMKKKLKDLSRCNHVSKQATYQNAKRDPLIDINDDFANITKKRYGSIECTTV